MARAVSLCVLIMLLAVLHGCMTQSMIYRNVDCKVEEWDLGTVILRQDTVCDAPGVPEQSPEPTIGRDDADANPFEDFIEEREQRLKQ